MSGLLHRPAAAAGCLHDLTPERAGWSYVGFALHRLAAGQGAQGRLEGTEAVLVVIEGRVAVDAAGRDWGVLGERLSVFERSAPHCLYLPPGSDWAVTAETDAEVALCRAPAEGRYPARRLGPEGITLTPRGKGQNTRHINNIAMEERDVAERLLVTEVFTPDGNWSSYPSHRHDEDDFPGMTYLEETYYHRINPGQGFGIQRVYTDDRSLDETMAVSDRDLVCVPRGHHPCGVPYGYEMYYLNVMAGPLRKWRFTADPDHAWIMARDG